MESFNSGVQTAAEVEAKLNEELLGLMEKAFERHNSEAINVIIELISGKRKYSFKR